MKDKLSVFDHAMAHLELHDITEDDVFYFQQLRISHDALLEELKFAKLVTTQRHHSERFARAIANAERLT